MVVAPINNSEAGSFACGRWLDGDGNGAEGFLPLEALDARYSSPKL